MKIITFGYRYPRTEPVGAVVILDARCLKEDPAEKTELGPLTGLDEKVRLYLTELPDVQKFVNAATLSTTDLERQDTIAIACHSGRHRSVYIAEEVAKRIGASTEHLDIDRPAGGPDDAPDFE